MSTFFKEAIKDIRQTGSLVPSSRFLAAKLTAEIDFGQQVKIIELGAGQGTITRHILTEMNESSTLTSFEINPNLFAQMEQIDDERLIPKMASALELSASMDKNSADYIISGIPLANMSRSWKARLLKSCYKILKPGGTFVQFQYALNDHRMIKDYFDQVRLGFTLFNFPPAFVYYAKKD